MKPSILIKIGITGMALLIVAGFIPLFAPLLDDGALKKWIGSHIDESHLTLLLFIFVGIIFYAVLKKDSESSK